MAYVSSTLTPVSTLPKADANGDALEVVIVMMTTMVMVIQVVVLVIDVVANVLAAAANLVVAAIVICLLNRGWYSKIDEELVADW